MTDQIIQFMLELLQSVFVLPEIVVVLIAILPIVEARLAVPIAMGYGIEPIFSWLLAFVGSSLIAPLLLLVLIPFIKWLSKTKLFRKIGSALMDKFEQKANTVKGANESADDEQKRRKLEWKKVLGVFIFVAIPLPLTGVWTGCAVASILKIKYPKALLAVIAGNFVASGIIFLLCLFFSAYINTIITVLGVIALVVVVILLIKIFTHKPKTNDENNEQKQ
ncbi:MAG: small multi-drug export protein [Clostridia bacterium]|nr:small multi-drug export protein [Clostridia bacterium]